MNILHVTAAVFRNNDQVLIARRSPDQPQGGKWEFPGGKIREGESPEACIVREISEELGVSIDPPEFFMESRHRRTDGELRLHVFFAHSPDPHFQLRVHDRILWIKPKELLALDLLEADIAVAQTLEKKFSP